MKNEVLDRIVTNPVDRRSFVKRVGATTIGVAAMTMMGGSLGKLSAASSITDTDILNFALNLEYLEGEFYSVAYYGKTLAQLGIIPHSAVGGPTTGGGKVPGLIGSEIDFIANALAYDEQQHVELLRSTLGADAVLKPTIQLDALGYGFASVSDFLRLARQFEDVGVSAYLGAAPLIQNTTYLATAGAILATEAQHSGSQHSGSIRVEVIRNGIISPAVDALDVVPDKQHPYDVDGQGLSIPRTTSQVLNIVYAGGSCSGGFFPDGVNGNINCQ